MALSPLSQISHTALSLRPLFVGTWNSVSKGMHAEARASFMKLASQSSSIPLTEKQISDAYNSYHQLKYIQKFEPHLMTRERFQELHVAARVVQMTTDAVNRLHNELIQHDETFRDFHAQSVDASMRCGVYNGFKSEKKIGFRGMQDWALSDPNSFAKPRVQFNVFNSTVFASGGHLHNGDMGVVIPHLVDPALAKLLDRQLGIVGWTKGASCFSVDLMKTAAYARRDFPSVSQQTPGYIYIVVADETLSMHEHLHQEVSEEESSGAIHNFEFVAPHSNPGLVIGVIPIEANGTLHEMEFNPNASPEAVKEYYRLLQEDASVAAVVHAANKKRNIREVSSEGHTNTLKDEFSAQMPKTAEEHAKRVELRKTQAEEK